MIVPYGQQDINQADIDSVVQVLKSDFITQGPLVPAFEKSVAEYCNANHSVATNNATSALHIACLALGLKEGGLVWTTPITFVASANCARYCGANVDFVDIDLRTYNMSIYSLRKKLVQARKDGALPDIVIPVHLAGSACDMKSISLLAKEFNFKVLEDASHAVGGSYGSEPIGSCAYSDITVFSFHPVKIITTGEGGMALTKDAELAESMRLYRSHGIETISKNDSSRGSEKIWNYQQIALGYNYRMTDMQAALGLSQMQRLDNFINSRMEIANRYDCALAELPILLPFRSRDSSSSHHLYIIRLELEKISRTHREVYEFLRGKGILVNLHYIPVYRQPYYQALGFSSLYCPNAERYFSEALSIPIHPQVTKKVQKFVIERLHEALTD